MSIVLIGLNHETAPVELREQFYLSDDRLKTALADLSAAPLTECVILLTCNRLEVYGKASQVDASFESVAAFLARMHHLPLETLYTHLYFAADRDAVRHLMRVAAGLNSLVLGEPQILGQVAHAQAIAQAVGSTGATLSHLFSHSIHAGKRARTETDISRHSLSISHTAALLARDQFGDLAQQRALVVGAGEMAKLAARALQMQSIGRLSVISRTPSTLQTLAEQLGDVQTWVWETLPQALVEADVVITATSAPHTVIARRDVEATLPLRGGRRLVLVDVAVPRDVEEAVGLLPGVQLYDIDDLRGVVDSHYSQRQQAALQVEDIIHEEVNAYWHWLNSRQVVPLIVDMRRKVEHMAEVELEHALRRMDHLSAHDQRVVEQLAHRIVNKLLHKPTAVLKAQAADGDSASYADIVRELFDLHETDSSDEDREPRSGREGYWYD